MKKTFKNLVSFILIASISLCLCVPAFAAGFDDVEQYPLYTCFGDSIPAIFREEGYHTVGFKEIEGSYPSLIRHACGAKLDTYAFAGFTTEQIRYWFEPDYVMSDFTFWAIPDVCDVNTVDAMRDKVMDSVRNSDLITINIGSNDVFSMPIMMTTAAEFSTYFKTNVESFEELVSALNTLGLLSQFLTFFLQKVEERMVALYKNMDAILANISKMNSDAEVAVIGMYNPFDGMPLTQNSKLAFGDVGYAIVNQANIILSSLALKYGYKYVDVIGTETYYMTSGLHVLASETFSYLSDYVHPTADGHRFMAEQILKVLPSRPQYEIKLNGIKSAGTVYIDTVPYQAQVKDGVVTVMVEKTCYKTATVYGSGNLKQVWNLSFNNGAYSAKAVSVIEAPATYVATSIGAILKVGPCAVKTLLKGFAK